MALRVLPSSKLIVMAEFRKKKCWMLIINKMIWLVFESFLLWYKLLDMEKVLFIKVEKWALLNRSVQNQFLLTSQFDSQWFCQWSISFYFILFIFSFQNMDWNWKAFIFARQSYGRELYKFKLIFLVLHALSSLIY